MTVLVEQDARSRARGDLLLSQPEAASAGLLIVDDDAAVTSMLRRILDGRGYEVHATGSGEDCLHFMDERIPEVVVLDIDIAGGIDGYETCRQIRRRFPLVDLSVIFLSGHDTLDDRVAAYDSGGDDFIPKPFDVEELRRKVDLAVKATSRRKQLYAEKVAVEAQAQVAAAEHHRTLQTIIDTTPGYLVLKDRDGFYREVNPAFCEFLGKPREEIVGKTDLDLFRADEATAYRLGDAEVLRTGTILRRDESVTGSKGQRWLNVTKSPVRDVEGRITGVLCSVIDITERKKEQEQLRIAATAFESHIGMAITTTDGAILRVNKFFTEITGYAEDEVVGQNPRVLQSGRHAGSFYDSMWDSLLKTGKWQGEIWNRRKSGEVYPEWLAISAVKDEHDRVTHYVGAFSDLTAHKAVEEKINQLAFFDPLTRLPNRRLLIDRLQQALASSGRSQRFGAVVQIDLDDFKTLNDSMGHSIGDMLLQQVAQRLASSVRERDTVARLGSDEFVIVLEDVSHDIKEAATHCRTVAEKILAALDKPYRLSSYSYRGTASIGATLFAEEDKVADELLKRSDLAMRRAKSAGRNTLRFFDPAMQTEVTARADLEGDLREAVQGNRFVLHYQAQVVGETRIKGAEVLLRWQHPRRGMVSPTEFIPLAEEIGLILPLGLWVLQNACRQLAEWAKRPELAEMTISVNVSARQFHHKDFVDQVWAVIDESGANPRRLTLELTESMLVSDVEGVIAKMNALKARGVGFSLDDFGTGYSSLSYLKRLPLDQLKIDQGFVRDILADANNAAIADMVIALAHSLGLAVVAEGVETEAHREFLAHKGCHMYQGYLFSRPLALTEFEQLSLRAFEMEQQLLRA